MVQFFRYGKSLIIEGTHVIGYSSTVLWMVSLVFAVYKSPMVNLEKFLLEKEALYEVF